MAIASVSNVGPLKGGSQLLEPYTCAMLLLYLGLLVSLLLWRRSPFYLPLAQAPRTAMPSG